MDESSRDPTTKPTILLVLIWQRYRELLGDYVLLRLDHTSINLYWQCHDKCACYAHDSV